MYINLLRYNRSVPIDYSEEMFARAESQAGGTEAAFAAYFDLQYEYVHAVMLICICQFYGASLIYTQHVHTDATHF